ncbi:hypothetical protein LCGC14_2505960 [marine sediment metagenome]|uniref:UBA domain-containing protein n=1 Tax=marine sediment metagenome TaxID=412755 RepID=A0A0F9DU31_9ZZZZ
MATYGEAIKALLRAGFSNRDVLDLSQLDGREAVKKLGEEALEEEKQKETQDAKT